MTPDEAARFLDRIEAEYDPATLDRLAARNNGQVPTVADLAGQYKSLGPGELQLMVNLDVLTGYWRNLAKHSGLILDDYDRLVAEGMAPDQAYSAASLPPRDGPAGILGNTPL